MKLKNIDAILFDSGRVLNVSRSGHWFIGPKFFDYVNDVTFKTLHPKRVKEAFDKGGAYIHTISLIETQEEELQYFQKFYELFAAALPELELSEADILGLAYDLVYNSAKYVFFEDGLQRVPELAKRYELAIVSDAWPSLESVYQEAGLRHYFKSFMISSQLGVVKPDPKMYQLALDELGIDGSRAIFVDDNLKNCMGAKALGIKPVLLCRDKRLYMLEKIKSVGKGYEVIYSLTQLR
ncbi:MAG TPA: HAD family hydrolase [Firmicutes bacterium]|nr:HAD family hydrolase [Bacillota bacterium]